MAQAATKPMSQRDIEKQDAAERKGTPPSRDELRRLIDDSRDTWQPLHSRMRSDDDLFYSAYKISLPKDVEAEGPTFVYTFKAAQQVTQAEGLLGRKKAQLAYAATNTRSDAARSRVELLQNHTNRGFDRLEQQSGEPTFSMVLQDVLKFGRGILCLEPDPRRIGSYDKALEDFTEPEAYSRDRQKFITRMGTRGGRLPMNLRHVPPTRFMYADDPERGGLRYAIERRDRPVSDVMRDPRYKGSKALEWVNAAYLDHGTRDDRYAGAQMLSVWTVQDRHWTSQFVTAPMSDVSSQSGRQPANTSDVFGGHEDLGEIAFQARNPLGRPWYVVTKGLRTSSTDATKSLVGIYFYATSLIKTLDWLATIQANALKDQAFAPWVYLRGQPTVNGQQMPMLVDPQKRRIRIARGNGFITELDPGTIQQLISEAPPELAAAIEFVRHEQNLLMIPEALYDMTSGSSGYQSNLIRDAVISKMNPLIEGMEQAMVEAAELYADTLLWVGETISVSTVQGDSLVETYTFDPKEYQSLDIAIDATFSVPRQADNMADAQTAAYVIEKRLLDVARARAKYMGETAHDEIERAISLDDYKRSPKVAEFIINKAAEEAGLTLEQQAAEAQGNMGVDQLLNTHPALLAQLAQQAQPGTPGYDAIMTAATQAGIVPPTAAAPQADPNQPPDNNAMLPAAPATPGPGPGAPNGAPLAAGQRQALPGGPRMGLGTP